MAIIGVKTGLVQDSVVGIKTYIRYHMDNGTVQGQSNLIGNGSFNQTLGRALNVIGNKAAERELPMANVLT